MRILILEDNKERNKAFSRSLIGHEVVIVEDVYDCIMLLNNEEWDALFLDHDLGGQEMVPSGPGTGYEVACWLEEHPDKQPETIYLHSLNPDGRKKMNQALPKAKEMPYLWKKIL